MKVLRLAERLARIVSVQPPSPEMWLREKEAVTPDRSPDTDRLVMPVNPLRAEILTANVVESPRFTVRERGLTASLKSGAGKMTREIGVVWPTEPDEPEIVTG